MIIISHGFVFIPKNLIESQISYGLIKYYSYNLKKNHDVIENYDTSYDMAMINYYKKRGCVY